MPQVKIIDHTKEVKEAKEAKEAKESSAQESKESQEAAQANKDQDKADSKEAQDSSAKESSAQEAKEAQEATQDNKKQDKTEAVAAEIVDEEVPLAAQAKSVEIVDEEVPLVLDAEVFADDEEKAKADGIGITVKGVLPAGSEAKAWPVAVEGNDFAAYQIVITDSHGEEVHSAAGDNKSITVIINDPELTKGLEKRSNVSGRHSNDKGDTDSKLDYEILKDGSVRFEADVF